MEKRSNSIFGRHRRAAYFLIAAVVVYAALCQYIGKVFIPRVVIPKVRAYLESGATGPLKVSIGDISFVPSSGFLLTDVRLYTSGGSPSDYVISAKKVDIDLEWYQLPFKRVVIDSLDMTGADLSVSRGSDGKWNFSPLTDMSLGRSSAKEFGGFEVTVKQMRLLNGNIRFRDRLDPDNSMERNYRISSFSVTGGDDGSNKIVFSSRSTGPKKGIVSLSLVYDGKKHTGKGIIKIVSPNVNDYWDYYIDDAMKPWKLSMDSAELEAEISYTADRFTLSGGCEMSKTQLDYGDLHIYADASGKYEYKRSKGGKPDSSASFYLKGVRICAGNNTVVPEAESRICIDPSGVYISALEGRIFRKPVSYKGMFVFGEPKRLSLDGQVCGIRNTLDMEITGQDKAKSRIQVFTSYSKIILDAETEGLKDLAFNVKASGDADLADLGPLFGIAKGQVAGKISVSGSFLGELDDLASVNGDAVLNINGFKLLEMAPKALRANVSVKNGLADCDIPAFPLYGGTASAKARLDAAETPWRWGFEADIEKCDLRVLSADDNRLAGLKGILDANVACAGRLGKPEYAAGGGYVKITDCNLKNSPVFVAIEKGMESVVDGFSMPDFKEIKASFGIEDRKLQMKSFCKSPLLKIDMSGSSDFSGNIEMTAGANVSGLSPIKAARQILIPVTLGFDFVKDGIIVKVSGKWPDLKQQTVIQPLRVLDELFGIVRGIDLRRYSLDEVWTRAAETPE